MNKTIVILTNITVHLSILLTLMQTTQYTTIKQKGTLVMAAIAHQQCPPTNQHQTLNLAPNLTNKILAQTS